MTCNFKCIKEIIAIVIITAIVIIIAIFELHWAIFPIYRPTFTVDENRF